MELVLNEVPGKNLSKQTEALYIFLSKNSCRSIDDTVDAGSTIVAIGVTFDMAKTSDTARFGRFFWEMMDRGVYLPCSQFEAAFTCAAMTDDHIAQTIQAAAESLSAVAKG